MGKRLVRIFRNDLESKYLQIDGKEADVVFLNKSTFHGHVVSLENQVLKISDNRGFIHLVPIKDIDEVIFDKESSY